MIEIVPFKPEHMKNIESADSDIDAKVLSFIGDLDKRATHYASTGPAIAMLKDGEVVAIGGIVVFWKGSGEAWMMISPEGRKQALSLFRYMQKFIDGCFIEYGFHRIQASILYDHKEAHRCAMRLGFIPEGMMVKYGPNKENYIRYVRLT